MAEVNADEFGQYLGGHLLERYRSNVGIDLVPDGAPDRNIRVRVTSFDDDDTITTRDQAALLVDHSQVDDVSCGWLGAYDPAYDAGTGGWRIFQDCAGPTERRWLANALERGGDETPAQVIAAARTAGASALDLRSQITRQARHDTVESMGDFDPLHLLRRRATREILGATGLRHHPDGIIDDATFWYLTAGNVTQRLEQPAPWCVDDSANASAVRPYFTWPAPRVVLHFVGLRMVTPNEDQFARRADLKLILAMGDRNELSGWRRDASLVSQDLWERSVLPTVWMLDDVRQSNKDFLPQYASVGYNLPPAERLPI